MAIKRGKAKQTNFTIIDNSMINDNLSWAARGLLTYLISKPEDWEVSTASLVNQTKLTAKKTGRDGVYSLINELIETGYMVRGERLHDKFGRMGSYDYTVFDSPRPPQPDQAQPTQANPTQVSNDLNKEIKVKQISNKEIARTKSKLDWSACSEVNVDHIAVIMANRKAKRVATTQRAVNGITKAINESLNQGCDIEQIINLIAEKGWSTYKHEWLINSGQSFNQPNQQKFNANEYLVEKLKGGNYGQLEQTANHNAIDVPVIGVISERAKLL